MNSKDSIPLLSDNLSSIYKTDLTKQEHRHQKIVETFESIYSTKPSFVVRAPGRVNIIGEHIDYEGYSVLPMAIDKDIVIALRESDAVVPRIHLCNTNPLYSSKEFPVDPDFPIDSSCHDWSHYFQCGYKGVFDAIKKKQGQPSQPGQPGHQEQQRQQQQQQGYSEIQPKGMMILVDGTIPSGSGLSSSSALVVASALATCVTNGFEFSRTELAELTCSAEHYIGTMGGGMDQAISCLGEHGTARHIMFNPLRTQLVKIPNNGVIIVANSMTIAEKAVDSATHFNKRVVECLFASKLLAKQMGLANWRDMNTLKDLEVAHCGNTSKINLDSMISLVQTYLHQEPYTTDELEILFGYPLHSVHQGALRSAMVGVLDTSKEFKLMQRAVHVFSEAAHVLEFFEACSSTSFTDDNEKLVHLGQLMNQSHASCRDLYECSCVELDNLVHVCNEAGALGARLTGAGWGGSVVCLVRDDRVDNFLAQVKTQFYSGKEEHMDKLIFSSKPAIGAAICKLSSQ